MHSLPNPSPPSASRSYHLHLLWTLAILLLAVLVIPAVILYTLNLRSQDNVNPITIPVLPTASPSPTLTASQPPCPLENTNNGDYVTLTPESGHCRASFPLDEFKVRGYTFTYPSGWTISVRGANGANLGLTSLNKTQEIYFHTSSTNLPFDKIDQSYRWSYETLERDPIIRSNEIVMEKTDINFDQNKTLFVKTQDKETQRFRYFLLDENNTRGNEKGLYILEYQSFTDTEKLIAPVIDQILSTFKFLDNE